MSEAENIPTPAPVTTPPEPTAAEKAAALKEKKRKRRKRALRDLIIRTVLLALVVYVLLFHLVGVTLMPSGDMYPRIDAGDLVLFYRLDKESIKAQDVIVFEKPTDALNQSFEEGEEFQQAESETAQTAVKREKTWWRKALDFLGFKDPEDPPMTLLVCRVVAGPGDTVEISEGESLIVNGNSMMESNIFYRTPQYAGFVEYPLTLGEGEYFVLADHRNGGADSRFFGAVTQDDILGTVITIARRNNL